LMNPTEQLSCTKTPLTQTLAKNSQAFQVKIKKVGRHSLMVAKKSRFY